MPARRVEALFSPPRSTLRMPITLYDSNINSPVILLFLENNTRSSSCRLATTGTSSTRSSLPRARSPNDVRGSAAARGLTRLSSCSPANRLQRHCGKGPQSKGALGLEVADH